MSNEELVAEIQAGATERMGELWEQIRRFVIRQARRVPLEGRADAELDDLIQSGYLALTAAVADYKPEVCTFTTHLVYHLKTAFAEATRFRSERQQRETLAGALSLDAPVNSDEGADTLAYFQEDIAGVEELEGVEDRIYQAQLHEALETALAEIPEKYADVLRLRHYQDMTLTEVGNLKGVGYERIRQMEKRAIRHLRKPSIACNLRPFLDFDFYCGTGYGAFQRSGMSIQERYLILEEDRKERSERRRQEREEKQLKEKQLKESFQSELERIHKEAQEKIARMTPEEKQALLAKCGYA